MWRFLIGLGFLTLAVGALSIAFGSTVFVSTSGNTLIIAGALGFIGGALMAGVGAVLRDVQQIRRLFEAGGALARVPAAPDEAYDTDRYEAPPAHQGLRGPERAVGEELAQDVPRLDEPHVAHAPDLAPPLHEPPFHDPHAAEPAAAEPVEAEPIIAEPPVTEPDVPAAPVPERPPERLLGTPRGALLGERVPSFAERLRAPLAPRAPAPGGEGEEPVADRRGRILGRGGDGEPVPVPPRPRPLLDRLTGGRTPHERPIEPATPREDVPALAPEPDLHTTEDASPVEAAPHEVPSHEVPGHEAPAHDLPAHELPGHDLPGHDLAGHEPPQPEPAAYVPEPPAPEEAPAEPPLAPAPRRPAAEPTVLKSGIVGGMAFTLYSDGSIQAELPDGVIRFASLQELRDHVARGHGGG